jgi:hypothetical protein
MKIALDKLLTTISYFRDEIPKTNLELEDFDVRWVRGAYEEAF